MEWDQTFNDSSKIWLDGGDDAITPPKGAKVATFTNPVNMRTYKAMKMGDPKLFSIGFAMVEDAEKLAKLHLAEPSDWSARYDLEFATQHIELVRGMYALYGYAIW